MANRGEIEFETFVQFPETAFEAARLYLGLMAYPELGEGRPAARGSRFTTALWQYYMWQWRRARGLREVRDVLQDSRFKCPTLREFKGVVDRGRRRIMRRFAAFDIVGNQLINGILNSGAVARRMAEAGTDPYHRYPGAKFVPFRPEVMAEAMPSAREIIRSNPARWSERIDLKNPIETADPVQKERDLVARGFMQSRPVIHLAHGLNQMLADHEAEFYALGDADWVLVLLWNCELWVWEAITLAESWRQASAWDRMAMLSPELMVELALPKKCKKLPSHKPQASQA